MAYEAEASRRMQMSLIEMNDNLEKVLTALSSLEAKVNGLEAKMDERKPAAKRPPPSLPPKPAQRHSYVDFEPSPTYEEVGLAPVLPYRKRGKLFSTKQLEYMRTELNEIKQYVNIMKNKDENEKMKMIGSLNCLIGSLQPPPGTQ